MQKMQVQSLGQEDPLEKEMAHPLHIVAWETPHRGAWRATVHGVTKESDNLATKQQPQQIQQSSVSWA